MNEQTTEAATETTVAGKNKAQVDLITKVASEVEGLTKVKALNEASRLADNIEVNYLKLGGVLKVIYDNAWFEGFESFGQFVFERFGFQERKAKYLMEIYDHLVTKQIPWDKVSHLGWTKLKDLARHLTPENVDEWVAKAEKLTVSELQQVLKGDVAAPGQSSSKTADDVTTVKFKLKNDALETVQSALNKAKAEGATEYDNVALELICAGYLGGTVSAAAQPNLKILMEQMGWEAVLTEFGEVFPNVDLTVDPKG